jgi:hypothetical protein
MTVPYIYKCPTTGLDIQGMRDDGATPTGTTRRFELVHCPACGRPHIVEPTTGRLLSDCTPTTRNLRRAELI